MENFPHLTDKEWEVLKYLANCEHGATGAKICHQTGISTTWVYVVLMDLGTKGFIEFRLFDQRGESRKTYSATSLGYRLAQAISQI